MDKYLKKLMKKANPVAQLLMSPTFRQQEVVSKKEYPTIEECVHAILDDDLDNLQVLRQAVKDKFPKT